ncbi:MAG: transcriptional regulator GcvA [Burkholderiaceae bacterium]|jgi:DNA-binding transcriptional LysR family regulator|nr:transcriptional regulator GcvA [Burkholderiales bacterium]MCZ8105121.1 transcriptional regulator GcvA [Burkholderiales bacterium]MCZ8338566.1 transcriptional regulator GcvA [Burkholderiaceae bacterium]
MPLHRADVPPLELLRTFEAAARNLSFTRAAAELYLTQSAVSRQIKALEDDLRVPLFERRHRALALTDAGQALYRTTLDVLERLRETTRQLRAPTARRTFTVTTTVGFASLWLVPRLPRFTAAHPGVDVRLSAVNRMVDLDREDIDVAVRFQPRDRALGEPLFGESVAPVCAPALARDPRRPLREPADLARHVLLHTMGPAAPGSAFEWPLWLEAVGLPELEPAGRLHFSQYDMLVGAAIAGQGVALGRMPLLRDAIRDGRLVQPFARSAASPRGYFLVPSRRAQDDPIAHAFGEWLRAEAAADAAAPVLSPPRGSTRRTPRPTAPARRAAR